VLISTSKLNGFYKNELECFSNEFIHLAKLENLKTFEAESDLNKKNNQLLKVFSFNNEVDVYLSFKVRLENIFYIEFIRCYVFMI
jgi:hypothetical protein